MSLKCHLAAPGTGHFWALGTRTMRRFGAAHPTKPSLEGFANTSASWCVPPHGPHTDFKGKITLAFSFGRGILHRFPSLIWMCGICSLLVLGRETLTQQYSGPLVEYRKRMSFRSSWGEFPLVLHHFNIRFSIVCPQLVQKHGNKLPPSNNRNVLKFSHNYFQV